MLIQAASFAHIFGPKIFYYPHEHWQGELFLKLFFFTPPPSTVNKNIFLAFSGVVEKLKNASFLKNSKFLKSYDHFPKRGPTIWFPCSFLRGPFFGLNSAPQKRVFLLKLEYRKKMWPKSKTVRDGSSWDPRLVFPHFLSRFGHTFWPW
jgi:hypothetical protein